MPKESEVTVESVTAEADIAGIEAVLGQIDEKDLPEKESERAEHLRELIPGLDKASDEEVLNAFKTGKAGVAEGAVSGAPAAFTTEGYGFFNKEGTAVTDIPAAVQQFLTENAIGYKALGKDQSPKSLQDLVRTASRGHFNQEQYSQLNDSNKTTLEQLQKSQESVTNFEQQASEWDRILVEASRGNAQPFLQATQTFIDNSHQPVDNRLTDAQTRIQELESAQAGQEVFDRELRGPLQELATKHNIPAERIGELENYVLEKFANDPNPSISTPQALQYINQMLPYELENMGFTAGEQTAEAQGGIQPTGGQADSELQKQVQSLTAKLETLENAKAAAAAGKGPPGSSAAGEGAVSTDEPKFETAAEGFEYLRSR